MAARSSVPGGGDLLVRGGAVLDGSGAPAVRADVRVRAGVIIEVAAGLRRDGEPEIDAGGALVTPGFVDLHTHLDPTLFLDPDADPIALHGVTTVLTGNCSLSVAPIRPEQVEEISAVFSYIEDVPDDIFREHIPWTWGTWAEYRAASQFPMAVNTAALVGHTPLRMFVMGDAAWDRPADDAEREAMAAVLDESLRAGAFGLSTTYFDEDEAGRPVPARLADDAELAALFAVLHRHDALLQFVPDVLSAEPWHSIDRIVSLCAGRDLRITWTGLAYDAKTAAGRMRMLDRSAEHAARGVRIQAQYSPRPGDTRVNWDRSMAFSTLSQGWLRYIRARGDGKRRLLDDAAWREVARREWDGVRSSMFPVHRPEKVKFIGVAKPDLRPWLGRSLKDLAEARGAHPSDALADWCLANDLYPEVMAVDRTNDDPDGVASFLRHPATMLGSSDAGAHVAMMCAAGDATLALTRHVRERGDLTLEAAVHELTARAAELAGLRDRGYVRPGMAADLNVFALDELSWDAPDLVHDLPGGAMRFRRAAGGYRATIASGRVVQRSGVRTDERPGRMLDHGARLR